MRLQFLVAGHITLILIPASTFRQPLMGHALRVDR
jgi:hypothetical protein